MPLADEVLKHGEKPLTSFWSVLGVRKLLDTYVLIAYLVQAAFTVYAKIGHLSSWGECVCHGFPPFYAQGG